LDRCDYCRCDLDGVLCFVLFVGAAITLFASVMCQCRVFIFAAAMASNCRRRPGTVKKSVRNDNNVTSDHIRVC
jgi:hypothetical protein